MRVLLTSSLVVATLAISLPAWSQEAAPMPQEPAEAADPLAPAEPARPTLVAVIASGTNDINAVALNQAQEAALAAVAAEQERHGRDVRPEVDPGLTSRAAACGDDECFCSVARDAQARFLFVVLLNRSGAGYQASVLLVDAEAGQTVGSAAMDLPGDTAAFAEAMGAPLGPLLTAIPPIRPTTGRLVVSANQVGAGVFIDGERVGSTPLEPLDELAAGEHRVRVAFEGFQDFDTTVEVPAGGEVAVAAALVPTPVVTPVEAPPIWRRWWFWTAIGGAVVVTGLAVGLGVGLSQDSESQREWGVPFPDYQSR